MSDQGSAADLVQKLMAAIQEGEQDKAAELGAQLSTLHLKLDINVSKDEAERSKEKEFSVRVHVEDRVSDGCAFTISVKSSDTIGDLKRKAMLKHNFPMEVQRWIIGKKIREDNERLYTCNVKGPGHTIYLYLVTARSVGLNKENYEHQRQGILTGSGYPSIYNPSQPSMSSGSNQLYEPSILPVTPSLSGPEGMGEMEWPGSKRSSSSSRLQEMLQSSASGGTSGRPLSTSSETSERVPSLPSGQRSRTPPRGTPPPPMQSETIGWECPTCTYLNLPTRPGCEMCSASRPADYMVPPGYQMTDKEIALQAEDQMMERMTREAEDAEKLENFNRLIATDGQDLITNPESFQCPICFEDIEIGEGVVLRECLHMFCRDCLILAIHHCEEAALKCPFQDDLYSCDSLIQEREIKGLVTQEMYNRFLQRGLDQAESQTSNSYHCKTPDCHGWCIYEDLVNFFKCPVCRKENCLTCKAIHEGMDCKQYQDNLEMCKDPVAKQTKDMLMKLVAEGSAMHCPKCQVVVQKKGGCDWIKCSICKEEICWVTKGPRWGPKGEGDFSGGCKCRLGGKRCHPSCNNCH